ncbi:MAG TPA: ABC transporter permease subunit, partial [bacterium]|nr:ABC transporter permease subunit [bacterium]HEX68385.1 ABC transporter permease subunit [bacterium]
GRGARILDSLWGVVIAMSFVSIPFLIHSAREGFEGVDRRMERVARTLGLSPLHTFFRITLPLAKGEIWNGAVSMWARGMGEFGAIIILAYHPRVISIFLYEKFLSEGLKAVLPINSVFILLSLGFFSLLRIIGRRMKVAGS